MIGKYRIVSNVVVTNKRRPFQSRTGTSLIKLKIHASFYCFLVPECN